MATENNSPLFPNPDETAKDIWKGTPLEATHRVQIIVDGKEILGATSTHHPENTEELIQMLKDFVEFLEAPSGPIERL